MARAFKSVRKASFWTSIQHVFYKDAPETFDQTLLVQIVELQGALDVGELRQLIYERLVCPEAFYRFRSLVDLEGGLVVFKELDKDELDMDYVSLAVNCLYW